MTVNKLILITFLLGTLCFSACDENEVNVKDDITLEALEQKYNLQRDTIESRSRSFGNYKVNYDTSNVEEKYPFQTTLFFSTASEADNFLDFVDGDPVNVIDYYESHPDFYRQQLIANGIIDPVAFGESWSDTQPLEAKVLFTEVGTICQPWLLFQQICVGVVFTRPTGYPGQVMSVNTSFSGFVIGFSYNDLGGWGSVYGFDNTSVDFVCNFQVKLNMSVEGVGEFYAFPPESHPGYYDVRQEVGYIYQ